MGWDNGKYIKEVIEAFKNTSKETINLEKEDFNLPYDPTEEEKVEKVENGIITIERPDIINTNRRLWK